MNAADWLRHATVQCAAVSDSPRLDAEMLLSHALGLDRADMLLRLSDVTVPEAATVLLERRLRHEPVAYILGQRDFWTLNLAVAPGVLIPRPDSETLIEVAIAHFAGIPGPQRILDLGTGSGALLLAALDQWDTATGVGVDVSPEALAIASQNAARVGMADRATMQPGNWGEGLEPGFDLILCNPPYICDDAMLAKQVSEHEPPTALFGGPDGLSAYRILAPQIAALISLNGVAVVEIGFDQGDSAAALFHAAGCATTLHRDLGGRARCLAVTQRSSGLSA